MAGKRYGAQGFICYRRDDSAGHAGRVHDRLEREFGRDLLFMDVDSIPLGANFVKVLGEEVAKCDTLLAIIGPGWLDARDENGDRRLESPYDFVRIEIGTALKRGIPVIPILLEGTRVPKVDQLPDELKELALRNGLDVRHTSFLDDMERLIRGLKGAKSPQQPVPAAPPLVGRHRPEGDIKVDATIVHGAAQGGKRLLPGVRPTALGWMAAAIGAVVMTWVAAYQASVPMPWPSRPTKDPAISVEPGSGQSFRDRLANGQSCPTCPEMVVVPNGKFTMGSPDSEPQRDSNEEEVSVSIAEPLAVGKFAVTRGEFAAFVEETGYKTDYGCSWRAPGFAQDDRQPVVCVNWNGATRQHGAI